MRNHLKKRCSVTARTRVFSRAARPLPAGESRKRGSALPGRKNYWVTERDMGGREMTSWNVARWPSGKTTVLTAGEKSGLMSGANQ